MKTETLYGKMETSKGNLKRLPCPVCGKTILHYRDDTRVSHLPMKCKHCRQEVEVNIPPCACAK